MNVTIVGPNLRDQSQGQFHVHATGCGDLRQPKYDTGEPPMVVDVESQEQVAEYVYADIIDENPDGGGPEAYVSEFHFAPCTRGLS